MSNPPRLPVASMVRNVKAAHPLNTSRSRFLAEEKSNATHSMAFIAKNWLNWPLEANVPMTLKNDSSAPKPSMWAIIVARSNPGQNVVIRNSGPCQN